MNNCPFLQNAWVWLKSLKDEIRGNQSFGYLISLAVAVTLVFGLVVSIIDPNIHSFWDGVWYAWVTMTHVGYGDVVPTSFLGRLLASFLILFGLAVLALLTAIFSTALMRAGPSEEAKEERSEILAEIKRLHERLDQLEAKSKRSSK